MNELFRDEHPERVRHEEGGPNHHSLAVSHRLREDLSLPAKSRTTTQSLAECQMRSWTSANHWKAERSRTRQRFLIQQNRSWIGEKSLTRSRLACSGRQGHVQETCFQVPSSEQPGQQHCMIGASARSWKAAGLAVARSPAERAPAQPLMTVRVFSKSVSNKTSTGTSQSFSVSCLP